MSKSITTSRSDKSAEHTYHPAYNKTTYHLKDDDVVFFGQNMYIRRPDKKYFVIKPDETTEEIRERDFYLMKRIEEAVNNAD